MRSKVFDFDNGMVSVQPNDPAPPADPQPIQKTGSEEIDQMDLSALNPSLSYEKLGLETQSMDGRLHLQGAIHD
ncbi:hypothetical protein IM774_08435 [Erysipelotrichaceae bacterium RD49]|nr:hypothetical protein [Erysipelotrichaceae bacterium RD49]